MKICVLMGSPRLHRNTAALCEPLVDEFRRAGAEVSYIPLAEKIIAPCRGCYVCQDVRGAYGCAQHDDMYGVADAVIASDLIVLATPIYSWYCPCELKAVLDRFYGLAKYYGSAEGNFLAGKRVAILATHGYAREDACGPFETGIQNLCKHDGMQYCGLYSVRDEDNLNSFVTREAQAGARAFARALLAEE